MGFGEVLDASFQLYRRAFWQLAAAEAIIGIPRVLLQAFVLQGSVPSGSLSFSTVMQSLPSSVIIGLLSLGQMAAVLALAQQAALGRPISFQKAYGLVLARLPWLIGVALIVTVVIAALSFVFVIPGLVALVYLAPAIPLVMLAGDGVIESLTHSIRLVQGYFWRLTGVLVVTLVLVLIVNAFVSFLAFNAAGSGGVVVVTTLLGILLGSFPIVALYMQYLDLKMRKGELRAD